LEAVDSTYKRLADFIIKNLDFERIATMLEVGCGRGQLTIPFVKKVNEIKENFKIIAFDISAVPYEGNLEILRERIEKENLGKLITTVKGDVRNMKAIEDESIDLIISNELFCELERKVLKKGFTSFTESLRLTGRWFMESLARFPRIWPKNLSLKQMPTHWKLCSQNQNGFRHFPMK
jgi:cyclopropane fatty-acyl-phospholipid synthase-like methyltransferase